MISAKIVGDSINPQGDRITSMLITFPRYILAEGKTHRIIKGALGQVDIFESIGINDDEMLSKNSASSRAIPFNKMVNSVLTNGFTPLAWQKDHTGMQGTEYFTDPTEIKELERLWNQARVEAVTRARDLFQKGVTKQICNRLLEPYMYHTVLVTATEWDNFFDLRCPKYQNPLGGDFYRSKKDYIKDNTDAIITEDNLLGWLQINQGKAEIHIMALAEAMWDARNESTPRKLEAGEWHIPFEDKIDYVRLQQDLNLTDSIQCEEAKIKISTSFAARTSYTIIGDEKEIDYSKHIELYYKLISQDPLHASPMEHCSKAMTSDEYVTYIKGKSSDKLLGDGKLLFNDDSKGWCRNFRGFIQLREILENGNISR